MAVQPTEPFAGSVPFAWGSGIERCSACGGERLTRLQLTLGDGTQVDFGSCRDCEGRTYWSEGRELSLADVLARTPRAKPGTRETANRRTRSAPRRLAG